VRGGKLNPAFGTLWEPGRGLFSERFAAAYELTEMWGGEIAVQLGAGQHQVTWAAFTADTSALSGSLGADRGVSVQAAGEPANTGAPTSSTLAWDGAATVFGFDHHVAFALLDVAGSDAQGRRLGAVAGLARCVTRGPALQVDLRSEIAAIGQPWSSGPEAGSAVDVIWSGSAQALGWGTALATVAVGGQWLRGASAPDGFAEASLGALFGPLSLEAGWQGAQIDGASDHRFIAALRGQIAL